MTKQVYLFADGKAEGNQAMRELLGGKGAGLHEMTLLGLPVPPGFTITTEVCTEFYNSGQTLTDDLKSQVRSAMAAVEASTGAKFGDPHSPLLVSVRSGARTSMPGMMDTVLNLGLNDLTVKALANSTSNERFAYDSYRRFIQMYSDVVLGISTYSFEQVLSSARADRQVESDSELNTQDLEYIVREFKNIVASDVDREFPDDPWEQLWGAISAVFLSWKAPRAVTYRQIHHIPGDWGTAVNVQAMVFGNMGDKSATGVAFTRDPSTGEKRFFGEFLPNAQGEDVVAGIRTPLPINRESYVDGHGSESQTMQQMFEEPYDELVRLHKILESHYRDMQDIEFTVQKGHLYLLQTRTGKRTALAAVRIAVDMVREGILSQEQAIARVDPVQLEHLLHPRLDPNAQKVVIAKGLPASPGAASGKVVFSSERAVELRSKGERCLLVRHETSPEDIAGMDAADGILTALGGMTSHAAVVARGMGKPCVAGCGALNIDYTAKRVRIGQHTIEEGQVMTIDGANGEVISGAVAMIHGRVDEYFSEFMQWVDQSRQLEVRANADTPADAKVARNFGAQGIGLCRTEHMFFAPERILAVREMILASGVQDRRAALDKLFPMQKSDFVEIFRQMQGLPVTIRLLDPPLHEFLPKSDAELASLAEELCISVDILSSTVSTLREFNPMLGHRGCRLGISHPEIYEMQARAILEAAYQLKQSDGVKSLVEIMIPFISGPEEYAFLKAKIEAVAQSLAQQHGEKTEYKLGTMIEIPRAALLADKIAQDAEFFSFGTNDLTQMTFGLSRDDSGSFLPKYLERDLLTVDPFVSLDTQGVGELVRIACDRGRSAKTDLKIGICGEQGGDTRTIEFCNGLGFNYVSCSPFRVPIARLAAAQAALKKI